MILTAKIIGQDQLRELLLVLYLKGSAVKNPRHYMDIFRGDNVVQLRREIVQNSHCSCVAEMVCNKLQRISGTSSTSTERLRTAQDERQLSIKVLVLVVTGVAVTEQLSLREAGRLE